MEAYFLTWAGLLVRWAHIITGIAWIGSSFYFMWLDARLNRPPRDPESPDIEGDLWAVHGGGFYHAQKYQVAPQVLPEPLHWFKWEAYWTWITGFALLSIVYYKNPQAYLIDPEVLDLVPWQAVAISGVLILLGWLIYQLLCALPISWAVLALSGALAVLLLCWGVSQVFSGRGAFIQVGVMLGSIMVANVFFVIIPSQKVLVEAKQRGNPPDAKLGVSAKLRSTHNNYLTLPVVLAMISPHYPLLYTHEWNWLLLFLLFLAGALVRHFFNERNRGRTSLLFPALALLLVLLMVYWLAPRNKGLQVEQNGAHGSELMASVNAIVRRRCQPCHSRHTTHPTAPVAQGGVELDSASDIAKWAERIQARAVTTRSMPLANLTHMTEAERTVLANWFAAGEPGLPE